MKPVVGDAPFPRRVAQDASFVDSTNAGDGGALKTRAVAAAARPSSAVVAGQRLRPAPGGHVTCASRDGPVGVLPRRGVNRRRGGRAAASAASASPACSGPAGAAPPRAQRPLEREVHGPKCLYRWRLSSVKRKLRREAGMSMPLHQVSAVPPQDAASARVSRSKAKEREREEQNEKTLGHSMSHSSNISKAGGSSVASAPVSSFARTSVTPSSQDICRICHCEGDDESPLITPCRCAGSLHFVHQACLQQWIKSSDARCCELCKYEFVMETRLKPLRKWEKLQMTSSERRKIMCSVTFHVIAITCVVWSLYVLIDRTAEEIRQGQATGILEWPFWTKLVVVAIGFTGGLLFMYVQCKVYVQLWRRLKAYNRVIYVQNCPETSKRNIFEKSALTEPSFENKDGRGVCHSDTNSSCCTEPEDTGAEIIHV